MKRFMTATLFLISVSTSHAEPIEVGFSPDAGAEDLVLKLIHSSRKSIRLAAYSFTSKPIKRGLMFGKLLATSFKKKNFRPSTISRPVLDD